MDNPNMADILSVVSNIGRATKRQLLRQDRKHRKKGRNTTNSVAVPAAIKISQLLPADTGDYYYYQVCTSLEVCFLELDIEVALMILEAFTANYYIIIGNSDLQNGWNHMQIRLLNAYITTIFFVSAPLNQLQTPIEPKTCLDL